MTLRPPPTPLDLLLEEVRAEREVLAALIAQGDFQTSLEMRLVSRQIEARKKSHGSPEARSGLLQVAAMALISLEAFDRREGGG